MELLNSLMKEEMPCGGSAAGGVLFSLKTERISYIIGHLLCALPCRI
jgi:hypothetical protein